ncbi:hypothetical protein COBT_000607, partial [Conglomerata obtusa]
MASIENIYFKIELNPSPCTRRHVKTMRHAKDSTASPACAPSFAVMTYIRRLTW